MRVCIPEGLRTRIRSGSALKEANPFGARVFWRTAVAKRDDDGSHRLSPFAAPVHPKYPRSLLTYLRYRTLVALLAVLAHPASAADWPWWRGPERNGVVQEASGWPSGWPPRRLWEKNVGFGCTSPVVVGGRLYVMGWSRDGGGRRPRGNPTGRDDVFCLDARTGRELWRQSYRSRYQGRLRTGDTAAYGGPSSTPSLDRETGLLYTLGVDGDLQCWDTARQGQRVWGVNLYETYAVDQRPDVGKGRRDYGFAGSPLLYGDLVVVEVGAREGLLMAFDARTGRRRWTSELVVPAGHCGGPVPLTVRGVPCLATLALRELIVVRAGRGREGQVLCRYPWTTDFACNIATPAIAGDDRVLITSGYNHKAMALLDVRQGTARKLWESRQHAVVGTPVVFEDHVYTIAGSIKCAALATGTTCWSGGSFEHGSCLVTVPDRKVIAFGGGTLALLEANPGGSSYRELARVRRVVHGTCYPHVTLSDGILACKDRDGNLVCLSVEPREGGGPAPPVAVVAEPVADAALVNADDALPVFAWSGGKQIPELARLRTLGKARVEPGGAMSLAEGAVVVEGLNDALLDRCRRTSQFTIEVVVTPKNVQQFGPARIISFSSDAYRRNFTLGQDRGRFVLRLRTPATGENGMRPETVLCPAEAGVIQHLVVSYSPGRLRCCLDGKQVLDTDRVRGNFSNWSPQRLLFGDEWSGGRDWAGQVHRISIESRAIDEVEARRRFERTKGW
jgi:outer membrane protein assembly factor BamB